MVLARLWKLIELAVGDDASEEARTAAVMACHAIKEHGLIISEPNTAVDDTWARHQASSEILCSNCGEEIAIGCEFFLNRADSKRYHGGCIP